MKKMLMLVCALTVLTLNGVTSRSLYGQLNDQPRPLAPGILKVVPPQVTPEDTFSPFLQIPGLTTQSYTANYFGQSQTLHGQTQRVVFFRDVWAYEFSTLGLRQVEFQFKTPSGEVVNKHFYYMVYRVRNFGTTLTYDQVQQELDKSFVEYKLQKNKIADGQVAAGPDKFSPQFSLEGWVDRPNGGLVKLAYTDRYLPNVAKAIQQYEDSNRRLFDKFEIQDVEIPLIETEDGPGVWGVAVWENIEPRLNFISVYVSGFTNAYRIQADASGEHRLLHKELKLNYWRAGDSVEKMEDKITYGIPLVDQPSQQIEFCQKYELPGPLFELTLGNQAIIGERPVTSVEAVVDWETFGSPEVSQLEGGQIPESIAEAMKGLGFEIPAGTVPTVVVPQNRWSFEMSFNGEPRTFFITFAPQFWEKDGEGIRFLKSLDNFWVYR